MRALTKSGLWDKRAWRKPYKFAVHRIRDFKLFLTKNKRFRIRLYNKFISKRFHVRRLYEDPGNSQHVWVNEHRIIKLVKGATILDCGCGKGRWGYLLGKNHAVVGVDVLRNYLEDAKALCVYDGLVQADLAHLPFNVGSFDTVLAVEVIEHLSEADGVIFLKQIRSLGKKQVLTTPKEFVAIDFGKDHPETHRSFWTKEQIRSILV